MRTFDHPLRIHTRPARLLVLLLAGSTLTGADRALYLEPSDEAVPVARLDANDPAVAAAVPVLEVGSGHPGPWLWTEYRITFEGFIVSAHLSKDFSIEAAAPVHEKADREAPVVAMAEPGDSIDVVDGNPYWIQVRVHKTVPVYLKNPTPQPPALQPAKALDEPVSNEPGSAETSVTAFDPTAKTGSLETLDLPPEKGEWTPVPADPGLDGTQVRAEDRPLVVQTEDLGSRQPTRGPETAPGSPTRTLAGKLERSLPRPFGGARYPLRLKAPGSGHLAYVDASRLFVRDFRPFLGREVVITGEVRPLVPGEPELVILARTLSLAE